MPSRSASSRRSAGRPASTRAPSITTTRTTRPSCSSAYNQTVINLPATAYGLEAEINSHPVDGLTLQLGVSALSSNVEDIILPDSITEVEHDLPQAPELLGQRAGALRVRAGRRPCLGPGGRPVHGRFLLHGPVRPGREGKGLHRPERAGRVRGPGRALGGRGFRRQPHRRGIPRVRVRQLAVCGCRGRRLREAPDLWGTRDLSVRRGILSDHVDPDWI